MWPCKVLDKSARGASVDRAHRDGALTLIDNEIYLIVGVFIRNHQSQGVLAGEMF